MRLKMRLFAAAAVALVGLLGLALLSLAGAACAGLGLLAALLLVELREAHARLATSRQQLEATRAQLLFADRLVTVGQLAAGVSHEINNPLSFILANLNSVRAELARLQGAPSGEQRRSWQEALAETHEGAERVRLIVRDLQSFTRAESLESGPVDVAAVVRSAAKMAGHEIRGRARLVLEVDGAPEVHGHGARLCQVFLNLLLNAAHAIEPGEADAHTIRVTVRPQGPERLQVEVRDTGCGIPPENLERIFEPFFTTKPLGVGTGLGLAVCHDIITAHGGNIRVESAVGHGTTFQVELPPSRVAAEPERLTAAA